MQEKSEPVPARTPKPRWIGLIVIMTAVVLAVTVLPTVRRRLQSAVEG